MALANDAWIEAAKKEQRELVAYIEIESTGGLIATCNTVEDWTGGVLWGIVNADTNPRNIKFSEFPTAPNTYEGGAIKAMAGYAYGFNTFDYQFPIAHSITVKSMSLRGKYIVPTSIPFANRYDTNNLYTVELYITQEVFRNSYASGNVLCKTTDNSATGVLTDIVDIGGNCALVYDINQKWSFNSVTVNAGETLIFSRAYATAGKGACYWMAGNYKGGLTGNIFDPAFYASHSIYPYKPEISAWWSSLTGSTAVPHVIPVKLQMYATEYCINEWCPIDMIATATTDILDLQEIPITAPILQIDSYCPQHGSISHQICHSDDGVTFSDWELAQDLDVLALHRYWKTKTSMIASHTEPCVINNITIATDTKTYIGTHANIPFNGVQPLLIGDSIGTMNQRVKLLEPATISEITPRIWITPLVSGLMSAGNLKNKQIKAYIGFAGLPSGSFAPLFSGVLYDYKWDHMNGYVELQLRDIFKKYASLKVPQEAADEMLSKVVDPVILNANPVEAIKQLIDIIDNSHEYDLTSFNEVAATRNYGAGYGVSRTLTKPVAWSKLMNELCVYIGAYCIPYPDGKMHLKIWNENANATATLDATVSTFDAVNAGFKDINPIQLVFWGGNAKARGEGSESAEDYSYCYELVNADSISLTGEMGIKKWYEKCGNGISNNPISGGTGVNRNVTAATIVAGTLDAGSGDIVANHLATWNVKEVSVANSPGLDLRYEIGAVEYGSSASVQVLYNADAGAETYLQIWNTKINAWVNLYALPPDNTAHAYNFNINNRNTNNVGVVKFRVYRASAGLTANHCLIAGAYVNDNGPRQQGLIERMAKNNATPRATVTTKDAPLYHYNVEPLDIVNVNELSWPVPQQVWNSTYTYGAFAQVVHDGRAYESRINGNTGRTPGISGDWREMYVASVDGYGFTEEKRFIVLSKGIDWDKGSLVFELTEVD
jgi:hypothetical protein